MAAVLVVDTSPHGSKGPNNAPRLLEAVARCEQTHAH